MPTPRLASGSGLMRVPLLGACLLLLACPACRVTDVPLWRLPPRGEARVFEVDHVRDVRYSSTDAADARRHHLDLFLPRGVTGYPVVVLVHGGAWVTGDNRCCGLYSSVGEFLARHGIGAVLPNYRLSPAVRHPGHVQDVAQAVAWSIDHISEYGGRADQLFLVGHSAGGHLVSLLATDDGYLRDAGVDPARIRGVVSVSGVYDIPAGPLALTLGGRGQGAFRLGQLLPVRRSAICGRLGAYLPGIPLRLDVYGPPFGKDVEARENASPRHHVHPGCPPFLLVNAGDDLPTLPEMAEDFHRALLEEGNESCTRTLPDRNHQSVFFRLVQPGDPLGRDLLEWIWGHCEDGTGAPVARE